nr:MAG TPA: hypothetical protein [Caudoviricetes sp.]
MQRGPDRISCEVQHPQMGSSGKRKTTRLTLY